MLISDLPEDIRKIAEERRKEFFFPYFGPNELTLENAFDWRKTPEGHDYWENLDDSDSGEDDDSDEYGNPEDDGIFK